MNASTEVMNKFQGTKYVMSSQLKVEYLVVITKGDRRWL